MLATSESIAPTTVPWPRRPKRRMPSMIRIAAYHRLGEQPFCIRCEWEPPISSWREAGPWLVRAHIIDRVCDGLDLESNLAPLCNPCHGSQPMFENGDERAALYWFGMDGGCPQEGMLRLVRQLRSSSRLTPGSQQWLLDVEAILIATPNWLDCCHAVS
jgi:hypothetical protein